MSFYESDEDLEKKCEVDNKTEALKYECKLAIEWAKLSDYFLCVEGGVARVYSKTNPDFTPLGHREAKVFFSHIKVYKYNSKVWGGKIVTTSTPKRIYEMWVDDPDAIKYISTIFRPDLPFGDYLKGGVYYFNRWNGIRTAPDENGQCFYYLENIRENICARNEWAYEYVLDWMAQIVQHPEVKTGISLVVSGPQGVGKNTFIDRFMEALGEGITQKIANSEITGSFNGLLIDKLLVFVDESIFYNGHETWNKLKAMITDRTININQKGIPQTQKDNFIRFIFATNLETSIPLEDGNRRFVTLAAKNNRTESKFWEAIDDEFKNKNGYAKLIYILKNRDITKRDWKKIPIFDSSFYISRIATLSADNPVLLWLHNTVDGTNNSTKLNPFMYIEQRIKMMGKNYSEKRIDRMLNFDMTWLMYSRWVKINKNCKTLTSNTFAQILVKYIPSPKINGVRYKDFNDKKSITRKIREAIYGINTIDCRKEKDGPFIAKANLLPFRLAPLGGGYFYNPKRYIEDYIKPVYSRLTPVPVFFSPKSCLAWAEDVLMGALKRPAPKAAKDNWRSVETEDNWLLGGDEGV